MKINRLETHDRLQHFVKQEFDIGACCQDIIDKRPFGTVPFYIFAHARTDEDGVTKRMIWQPRLTKPRAQENSMLFKAYPPSDKIKVIWMIPAKELWGQFKKGNVTESSMVSQSIFTFVNTPELLNQREQDDLDDATIDKIYDDISRGATRKGLMDNLYLGQ